MNFLFVYSSLQTGGVETLIVRMANWLVTNGHNVKILLQKKGKLDNLVSKKVKIKHFGSKYYLLFHPILNHFFIKSNFFKDVDLIYSFEATGLLLSLVLKRQLKKSVKILSGIYQPNEYNSYSNNQNKMFHKIIKFYFDPINLLFVNEQVKKSVEKNLNIDLKSSRIWLLPIDSKNYLNIMRTPKKYKIVSVGRLVDFKTYNLNMINIIKDLISDGFNVTYDIHGNGNLIQEIKRKILIENMQKYVFIKGTLDYKKFSLIMKEAFVFIGMGTSLIEASMCGVPSLVAIFNNPSPTTYGFSHELSNFSCGEIIKNKNEYTFKEKLIYLINQNDENYNKLCQRAQNWALKFELNNVMNQFLFYAIDSASNCLKKNLPISILFSYFYNKAIINYFKSIIKGIFNKIRG